MALATCVLAYAVAFAMVMSVGLTRESGIEETVKQQPAQIAERPWLVCLATPFWLKYGCCLYAVKFGLCVITVGLNALNHGEHEYTIDLWH